MPNTWTGHPLAHSLLLFNALPSRLLHRSRWSVWMPFGKPVEISDDQWHRHCSALLLSELDRAPVLSLDHPALPLALLPDAVFDQLLLWCGVLVLAPSIQRVISKLEVLEIIQQLGKETVDFALYRAPDLLKLSFETQADFAFAAGNSREKALLLGALLLRQAFDTAPLGINQRGLLRLPEVNSFDTMGLPQAAFKNKAQALAIARSVTDLLEPQWLSSFPTTPH